MVPGSPVQHAPQRWHSKRRPSSKKQERFKNESMRLVAAKGDLFVFLSRKVLVFLKGKSRLFYCFQELFYLIHRYCESDVLGVLYDGQVYADKLSVEVQESSAAVAGINRGIGLE
jgi:hypothetical protein